MHNYRRKKQTFVKVIWVFISIAEINLAVIFYYLVLKDQSGTLSDEDWHIVDLSEKTLTFLN